MALLSCLPLAAAHALRPQGEALVTQANLCLTLPATSRPQVGVGWITRGVLPASVVRHTLLRRLRVHPGAVCATVPWAQALPNRGTLVFPP